MIAPQQGTANPSDFAICDTHEKRLRGKDSCVVCEWLAGVHSQYVDELKQEIRRLRCHLLITRIFMVTAFIGIAVVVVVKR